MTMHSHDRYRLLAAAALDRPLDAADEAELQEHLARCASCRTDVARMRADHGALADLPQIAPDPRVYAAVMAAARSNRRSTPWSALAVAAVLLLGGIGGAVLAAGALNRPEAVPTVAPSTGPSQDPQAVATPSPTSPSRHRARARRPPRHPRTRPTPPAWVDGMRRDSRSTPRPVGSPSGTSTTTATRTSWRRSTSAGGWPSSSGAATAGSARRSSSTTRASPCSTSST